MSKAKKWALFLWISFVVIAIVSIWYYFPPNVGGGGLQDFGAGLGNVSILVAFLLLGAPLSLAIFLFVASVIDGRKSTESLFGRRDVLISLSILIVTLVVIAYIFL